MIRLNKYLSEDTCNNIITLYKQLSSKEDRDKKLFLKAIVYNGIKQYFWLSQKKRYINPNDYFSPHNTNLSDKFDMNKLNLLYRNFSTKKRKSYLVYGIFVDKSFTKLI